MKIRKVERIKHKKMEWVIANGLFEKTGGEGSFGHKGKS
jgi:hypothetical protein